MKKLIMIVSAATIMATAAGATVSDDTANTQTASASVSQQAEDNGFFASLKKIGGYTVGGIKMAGSWCFSLVEDDIKEDIEETKNEKLDEIENSDSWDITKTIKKSIVNKEAEIKTDAINGIDDLLSVGNDR
ncbi:MAG: hypothetical protein IJ571_06695 [Ruminococcus sp.]|nr:hypothetical protein [Ruminococcus sp.]